MANINYFINHISKMDVTHSTILERASDRMSDCKCHNWKVKEASQKFPTNGHRNREVRLAKSLIP